MPYYSVSWYLKSRDWGNTLQALQFIIYDLFGIYLNIFNISTTKLKRQTVYCVASLVHGLGPMHSFWNPLTPLKLLQKVVGVATRLHLHAKEQWFPALAGHRTGQEQCYSKCGLWVWAHLQTCTNQTRSTEIQSTFRNFFLRHGNLTLPYHLSVQSFF